MTKIKYPSDEFPQLPSFEVEIPEKWEGTHFPGSIVAVIKQYEDYFSPNVIVNIKKVGESYSYQEYSDDLKEHLSTFSSVINIFSDIYYINHLNWNIDEYTYIHESIGALAQFNAVTLIPIQGAQFLVSFTGTTALGLDSHRNDYEDIRNIFRSMIIK